MRSVFDRFVCAAVLCLLVVSPVLAAQDGAAKDAGAAKADAKKAEELKLEDLFPKKSMFGKRARGVAWSHDDRYLTYLWNAYDDKGYDLWAYDMKEKKAKRLTTPEMFIPFDRELKPIIERYKKDKEEEERRKKLTDEERKKLEDPRRSTAASASTSGRTSRTRCSSPTVATSIASRWARRPRPA